MSNVKNNPNINSTRWERLKRDILRHDLLKHFFVGALVYFLVTLVVYTFFSVFGIEVGYDNYLANHTPFNWEPFFISFIIVAIGYPAYEIYQVSSKTGKGEVLDILYGLLVPFIMILITSVISSEHQKELTKARGGFTFDQEYTDAYNDFFEERGGNVVGDTREKRHRIFQDSIKARRARGEKDY